MVIFVIGEPKRLINKSITNKTINLKKKMTLHFKLAFMCQKRNQTPY
jgi:hypothetical protein